MMRSKKPTLADKGAVTFGKTEKDPKMVSKRAKACK